MQQIWEQVYVHGGLDFPRVSLYHYSDWLSDFRREEVVDFVSAVRPFRHDGLFLRLSACNPSHMTVMTTLLHKLLLF